MRRISSSVVAHHHQRPVLVHRDSDPERPSRQPAASKSDSRPGRDGSNKSQYMVGRAITWTRVRGGPSAAPAKDVLTFNAGRSEAKRKHACVAV